MPQKRKTPSQQDLLETKLSEITALIKELSPETRIEISFERHEGKDAHIHVYSPRSIKEEEVTRIELALGERCNDILSDTGFFIIGAVCD